MDQIKLEMKENTSNGHSSMRTNGLSVTSSTHHNGSSSEDNHHERTNKRELFLKAFEKPTQIYRYLRARHSISPIFLHRNLWYMKQRTTRDNSRRRTFKVDSIREIVEKRLEEMRKTSNQNNHFSNLVIRFSGIKPADNKSSVTVNVSLHTKNKHNSSQPPSSEILEIGECKFTGSATDKQLTLTKENFTSNAKHTLVFRVSILKPQSANSQHQLTNGNLNGDYTNGDLSDKEEIFSAPASKRRRTGNEVVHRYNAELVILGNSPETMLKDGEYNLTLNECLSATNGDCRPTNVHERFGKKVVWENAFKLNSQFKDYLNEPYLSFQLKWSSDLNGEIVSPKSCPYSKANHLSGQPLKQIDPPNNAENSHSNKTSSYPKNSRKFSASNASSLLLNGCATNGTTNGTANGFAVANSKRSNVQEPVSNRPQQPAQAGDSKVVYQFVHNNDELQLLKTNSDFMCPWCSIQCFEIFSLKNHLRFVHSRFNFASSGDGYKGYKIHVTINESFDGSYCGNPHFDMSNFTSNSRGKTPVQRTPVTLYNLNLRNKRQRQSWLASLENELPEIEIDPGRPEVFGHNRLYYHSGTCQPIKPHEMDEDSEDERDPEWMRIKTQIMIDEFSDVNEGEKEVMKLWNLHMMKHSFVGWGHVPLACELFIKENWQEIVKRNIYMNFVLHLNNLLDYQLLSSDTLRNLIKLFHELKSQRN